MGDRSWFSFEVFACPPEQRAALIETASQCLDVEGASIAANTWPPTASPPHLVGLDAGPLEFVDEEANIGVVLNTDWDAVIAAAPGATWWAQSDPKYEWDGVLACYSPETGLLRAHCDGDGNAHITHNEAADLLEQLTLDPTVRAAVLGKLFPTAAWRPPAKVDG